MLLFQNLFNLDVRKISLSLASRGRKVPSVVTECSFGTSWWGGRLYALFFSFYQAGSRQRERLWLAQGQRVSQMQSWELSPLLLVLSVQLFSASHNVFQMDHFLKCIKLLKIQYGCYIAFQRTLFLTTLLELLSKAKLMVRSVKSYLYFLDNMPLKLGISKYLRGIRVIGKWICVWIFLQVRGIPQWEKKDSFKISRNWNDHEEQNLIDHQKELKNEL